MNRVFSLLFPCLLVFFAVSASAQSRHQPFRFRLTPIDAKTYQPRSTFFLGESVSVRVSLTNQSRTARTIARLPDTPIQLKLSSMLDFENGPDVRESYVGGTGTSSYVDGIWFWGERPAVMITIAPGQTVSMVIRDVGRHFVGNPLQEGRHTLTANYNTHLRAEISFRVVADEAKSVPLLKELAEAPVQDGDNSVQVWARATLNLLLEPSVRGRIVDTEGNPLKEDVEITATDTKEHHYEGKNDGRYRLDGLKRGHTYTITPSIPFYNHPGVSDYTFEPASRTITNLNGKITDVNFVATRIRVSNNVALKEEGATAKASSTRDDQIEPESVIDGSRMPVWGVRDTDLWTDGTPNSFPDWIEVDFAGARRINWINVFTLPDNYNEPPDPDLKQTFSRYGVTDFDVQYWTGRAWRTVPNGAIRGNRNVWRMISFPALTTDKIRVVVRKAMGGQSRITEIEACHLNDLPQAKIVVTDRRNAKVVAKAKGYTDSPVYFRTEAFDRDGSIRTYELDFGDKDSDYEWNFDAQKRGDKPELIHTHTYDRAGTYKVRLKVVDDNDEPNDTTILVTITDPPKTTAKPTVRNKS